jgi:hypothetical protein
MSIDRRDVLKFSALAAAVGLAGAGRAQLPAQGPRAVELTFLKSKPGQRGQLMSAFTVLDTGTDEGPWNVLVSVTYMDEQGYPGIEEAFEKIRSAHTTVLVDGKGLRELGSIVDSKRLFEDPAHASK